LDSGFESPQVSADELVTLVRDYGDACWKRIRDSTDVPERYGLGVVMGVFLSILHPKLRDNKESIIHLVSARDRSKEVASVIVDNNMRNMIRKAMEKFGIEYFELPVQEAEGVGASERKESMEVDDLELERKDGRQEMTIAVDRGISMRLI
jgi:hypothetical protein